MLQNTAILKIGGGLIAAGGATTVGVVYKDNISKWLSEITSQKNEDYLLLLGSKTSSTSNVESSLQLYTTADATKITTKNYQCKIDDKKYECDIIKKIDSNDKKWISTKGLFDNGIETTKLTKDNINTENSLFSLKLHLTNKEVPDFSTNKTVSIIQKDNNSDGSKKFAELTTIFSKKNSDLSTKANLFLAKVKDITDNGTKTEYQIETGKTYKCSFDNNPAEVCSILKFTTSEQTDMNATKTYSELTFLGSETALTASDKLKQHNYYIVKFTNAIESSEYLNKELIYLKVDGTTPEKIINFSAPTPAFLSLETSDKKLLLVD